MSAARNRYATLRAIVASSPVPNMHSVDREFLELEQLNRVGPSRRRFLLQTLHSTRAFDTALNRILVYHGLMPEVAIGKMLRQLNRLAPSSPYRLPDQFYHQWRQSIGNVRNRFMHEADAYPSNQREVDALVGEIHGCLLVVLP